MRLAALAEALLTPHGIDRYLELVHPMLVRRELRGEVTAVEHQTADTVTLTLRPSSAWRGFQAGQYVRVSVDIDGVRRTRCYSPAGSQHRAGQLELTIKEQGLVSGHLQRMRPGQVVGLSQADGAFTLPGRRPKRLLMISGGSGITPLMAMLRTLADEGHDGEVVFLHYANTPADLLYAGELARQAPNVRVVTAYTHAGDGFFSRKHLVAAAPWYADAPAYVCGPAPLMDAVRAVYDREKLGAQLITEEFTPPELVIDETAAEGTVRFAHSGVEFPNSGRPLLEQAEEAGLSPEHGCRMGICFSCTKVKARGRVRNAKSGEVSGEDNEEIQLCISVPAGDVEIDA
ncbi:ferredoxin reductase [Amycolatopsis endophytica]|uniref:Ferredoxin-NADP reductase n=1 Tax=Amycolatopsis endophytica TaxID=860233 RepID=A0A853B3E2_9PSEU|nr:ferredoxin reductase [Amycolatopsis endophytica]NYI89324.1 ferredoxin-NADP reductase [Amycolatopsis endophytica]